MPANFENSAALLALRVATGVENHSVAGFQFHSKRVQLDMVMGRFFYQADEGTALFAEAGANKLLMIHAMHPAGIEPAGKCHLEAIPILRGDFFEFLGQRGIQGFAVNLGHGGDIFRGLEAAFDFERAHAPGDEIGDLIHRREVLGRKKVALVAEVAHRAIHNQLIRHPAGLGAFAPVRTATAEGLAGEALPGISHAECAVDESLQRHRRREFFQLPKREFPGEDGLFHSQPFGKANALGRGDGHLGGGMNPKVWKHPSCDLGEADILNDHGIDSGVVQCLEFRDGVGQLVGENQDIQRHIALHSVAVEEAHHLGQILLAEVVGAHAGVEFREAKKNGVRAIRHGGFEAIPVPGRREKFRRLHQCAGAMMIRISGFSWRLSK